MTQEVANLGFDDALDRRIKLPAADDDLRVLARTFNEMLSRIDEGVSKLRRFSGDVSHELRTPLAVLRGEAELALRRTRTPEEYQKALMVVVQESSQMSNIVEDLLLLAKAQGRAIAIDWQYVTVLDFVDEVVKMVKPTFDQREVNLNIRLNAHEDVKIRVGGIYLALAIKNLLLNACKYSSPKGEVIFSVECANNKVKVSIRDFGEGIPEEALPFIFDMFFRVDSARNRNNGGVGIGLSLAKALAKLHNGNIEVESQPGQGATFSLVIPLDSEVLKKSLSNGSSRSLLSVKRSSIPFFFKKARKSRRALIN
jgi:signal transduction histidine kinase